MLSHLVAAVDISVTDLAEARAIAVQNIEYAGRYRTNKAILAFDELNWGQPLFEGEPVLCDSLSSGSPERERVVDLVVAADCTYNADSRSVSLHFTPIWLMLTFQ